MNTVKIRLYNVGRGKQSLKLADLDAFDADGTAIIGGQEFGDQLGLVTEFIRTHPNWKVLWEQGTNPGRKTPILYNSDILRLTFWQQILTLVPGVPIGPGAGPDKTEAKRLNKARFVVKGTKVAFKFLNFHGTASVHRTQGRVSAWEKQAAKFFAVVRRTVRMPVVGGADWNLERSDKLMVNAIGKTKWVWDSIGPTHGRRTIDMLGHKGDYRVSVVARGVDETDGSRHHDDHKSPWVEYLFKK